MKRERGGMGLKRGEMRWVNSRAVGVKSLEEWRRRKKRKEKKEKKRDF